MAAHPTDLTPDPTAAGGSGEARAAGSEMESSRPASTAGVDLPLAVGDAVLISRPLPYLKTADPMPMLRPPDLIDNGEVGIVRERRQADALAVRFRRGTFLLAAADLRPAAQQGG